MAPLARPGPEAVRGRNRRRRAALLLAACALAATAACSSDGNETAKQTPSASSDSATQESKPSAETDPTEQAKAEAVGTYEKYWEGMEDLYADKNGKITALKQLAAGVALASAEADAKQLHDKGAVITGGVVVGNPTVTKVDIDRKIPNATISTCLDVSGWIVIDTKTNKPAPLPSTRLTKYVVQSVVEKWPEGWRVIKDEQQGKAC